MRNLYTFFPLLCTICQLIVFFLCIAVGEMLGFEREEGGEKINRRIPCLPPPRPLFTLRPRLASASGLPTPFLPLPREICGQRRRRFLKQKGEGGKEKGWCAQKKFVRWLENWLLKLPPSSMAHPFAFQHTHLGGTQMCGGARGGGS